MIAPRTAMATPRPSGAAVAATDGRAVDVREPGAAMRYRPEVDGLRAVAVIPVILFHAGVAGFAGGFVGVDIFFVISGYLITTIIVHEAEAGKFSIVRFYERRARRILPALFVVLLATLPVSWLLLLPSDMASYSKSLLSISAFASNVFFWSERGYFGTATELKPLIHTWSLAIEEQYYLFFPLLLVVLVRARRRKILFAVLAALGVASLGLSVWLTKVHVDSAFFLLPTRIWELLVGSLLAIFCFHSPEEAAPGRQLRLKSILEVAGLLLITAAIVLFDGKTPFPGYAALVPTVGTALVIYGSTTDSPVGRLLGHKLLVGVGLASYSAYLWHQPIFTFYRHYAGDAAGPVAVAFLIGATIVASYLSWRYVEQPFRDRKAWSRRAIFKLSAAGLTVCAGVGAVGWRTDGFLLRYPKEDQAVLMSFVAGGDYTDARFDRLKLAAFDGSSRKKKVVVIGDSYAKDLVNAIAESKLSELVQLSTYQISGECGNLYLDEDFSAHIDEDSLPRCKLNGWYDDPQLQQLIAESDAVWLASSWREWVADLLPASIRHIEQKFGKRVLVFGRKNFGKVAQRDVVRLSPAQRRWLRVAMEPEHVRVEQLLKKRIPPRQFVDVSLLLCGSEVQCRLFTDAGEILSYDGGHLARGGARLLGDLIYDDPAVQSFLN